MEATSYLTSVERIVPAPAERIFDILADPARHQEIDGSGSVGAPRTPAQRLMAGSSFVMSMGSRGIRYSTVSTVVEFEENRRIAWQTYSTIKWLGSFGGGRIWRYELEPADGRTLVRETWDTTFEGPTRRRKPPRDLVRNFMITSMEKTLLRIEEVTAD